MVVRTYAQVVTRQPRELAWPLTYGLTDRTDGDLGPGPQYRQHGTTLTSHQKPKKHRHVRTTQERLSTPGWGKEVGKATDGIYMGRWNPAENTEEWWNWDMYDEQDECDPTYD